MDQKLSQSIFKTLAFFDTFDYPLTREELYRFLWQPPSLSYEHFFRELEQLPEGVFTSGGYYGFVGIQEKIAKRERKVWFFEKKLKRAKRATRILRYVPFVDAVFVCNLLPVTVHEKSDIDVFIVVRNGRMWMTRLFVTLILHVFRLRRHGNYVENRICLSFYTTSSNLNLKLISVPEDVYMSYWCATLIPVYDRGNVSLQFRKRNKWVRSFLPNALIHDYSDQTNIHDSSFSALVKRFFEIAWKGILGDVIEEQAKEIQMKKMLMNTSRRHRSGTTNVIISDTLLKFHENDRRGMYKAEWEKRWHELVLGIRY